MTDTPRKHSEDSGDNGPEPELTVDLTLDDPEAILDLQALADEVADEVAAVPEAPAPAVEDPLRKAQTRIQELEKLDADHVDKYRRLLADFANYRNRTGRDIQMAVDQSERRLLIEFLPVVDNFERCLGAVYQSPEDFNSGVALIQKQFMDALRKIGVEAVALSIGDPFDALHAEALTTVQDPALPEGAVAAIYERGYTLRNQLLRAARVVVNSHPQDAAQDADSMGNV